MYRWSTELVKAKYDPRMLPRKGSRKCSRECSRKCTRECPQKLAFSVLESHTKAPTRVLTWVLTRVPTQVYTKWFGRMSPGLFSPALFLTQCMSLSWVHRVSRFLSAIAIAIFFQPAPKYHTKGCSRSSADSPGAWTLVFAAFEPFPGRPRFGSVRLRFGDGTVRAVPVFGSGGSSAKKVFLYFSTV